MRIILVVCLLLAWPVRSAVPLHDRSQIEVLYDSMNAAYQPLKNCVHDKLVGRSDSRHALYSEIAASGRLPQILFESERLLDVRMIDKPAQSDRARVQLLIETLQRWESGADVNHTPHTDGDYMYMAFRLRRQIAADVVIGRTHSVSCRQPAALATWIQEEDDFETTTNFWSASKPFLDCQDKYIASIGGRSMNYMTTVVHGANLQELLEAGRALLDPSNPFLVIANRADVTDEARVRALLSGLGAQLHSGSKGEAYGAQERKLLVIFFLERASASATKSKCVPSARLVNYAKILERRIQE